MNAHSLPASLDKKGLILLYGLCKPRSKKPFYIGCGSKSRMLSHWKRFCKDGVHFNSLVREELAKLKSENKSPDYHVFAIYDSCEPARLAEKNAIRVYGRCKDGGCLCNVSEGGGGPSSEDMRKGDVKSNLSFAMKSKFSKESERKLQSKRLTIAYSDSKVRQLVSKRTKEELNKPETRKKHLAALKKVNSSQNTEFRSEVQKRHYEAHPERRLRISEWAKKFNADPEIKAIKSLKSREANLRNWADPVIRAKRIAGMKNRKLKGQS